MTGSVIPEQTPGQGQPMDRSVAELTIRTAAQQHKDAGNHWQAAALNSAADALIAPAIDLEQFRNAVEAEYQIACASHNTGLTHSTVLIAAVKKRQRLLALIDGQAKSIGPKFRELPTHGVYRRSGDHLPCYCWADADHMIGDEQPSKGEGE